MLGADSADYAVFDARNVLSIIACSLAFSGLVIFDLLSFVIFFFLLFYLRFASEVTYVSFSHTWMMFNIVDFYYYLRLAPIIISMRFQFHSHSDCTSFREEMICEEENKVCELVIIITTINVTLK